ncbi:hypothetical protein PanWU01x14_364250 [Parasponia andersonii]|uniref:Uncharacterized protein n=1 Tax=Parasponia andersonii TaxID=3476 RepID=A0A2P5A6C2_PARAD|nr:hypothetical protein PanWU01x14_364250 [Parasponia andersonii]
MQSVRAQTNLGQKKTPDQIAKLRLGRASSQATLTGRPVGLGRIARTGYNSKDGSSLPFEINGSVLCHTKNGAVVGTAYKEMKVPLFPIIAVHSQNEEIISPPLAFCVTVKSLLN